MHYSMFLGLLLAFTLNHLVFSDNYSDFSSSNTCLPVETDLYIKQSLFKNLHDTKEITIEYAAQHVGSKTLEFMSTSKIYSSPVQVLLNISTSTFFFSQFMGIKKYVVDNFGIEYWPKQIRLIYAGDQIAYLPGIGALFCRAYQTSEVMTLIVTTNFLKDPRVFGRILAHEIYHYLMHSSQGKIPFWLEEGLALNFEDHVSSSITSSPMMDWHMAKSPWSSLSTLGSSKTLTKKTLYSFYGQANLLIYYIQKNIEIDLPSVFLKDSYTDWKTYLEGLIAPKWPSFEALFLDFQIAKYINRTDDFNLSATTDAELYKYTLLPRQLSSYIVEPTRKPIDFTPDALSAFIPTDPSRYGFSADYTIKWINLNKFAPIVISDKQEHVNSFPLVIRWK